MEEFFTILLSNPYCVDDRITISEVFVNHQVDFIFHQTASGWAAILLFHHSQTKTGLNE